MHADITNITLVRQVFPSWSIEIPVDFAETFVVEDGYWHGYDADRSVSLSSIELTHASGERITVEMIAARFPPPKGAHVDVAPPGLAGWVAEEDAVQPARASRMLSGMLAAEDRLLLATITSDDIDWAWKTWRSIRWLAPARHGVRPQQRGAVRGGRWTASR